LARNLLAAGDTALPAFDSGVAGALARLSHGLSSFEIDQLSRVVEEGGRVQIQYRSASGAITTRVIDDPELNESVLYAWCELRQDERVFSVSRILSVAPVG